MAKRKPETEDEAVLRRFMQEFFHFPTLLKAGFFSKDIRHDYKAQAARVCRFFGFKTVFEYGAKETRCHLSYVDGKRPANEPFFTVIPSIYD